MGVFCVAWIGLNLLTEFALGRLLVSRFDGIGFLVLGGFYFFFFFFFPSSRFLARGFSPISTGACVVWMSSFCFAGAHFVRIFTSKMQIS